ncbi:MAG: A/G-specific adenine glycosylase, partial [Terriglobales bacterium]
YALRLRNGSVYLKQRGAAESLMPGMWELPEFALRPAASSRPQFTLRHSITVTDFTVSVVRVNSGLRGGRWVPRAEAACLPLTGLARKILRRAGVI